MSVVLQVPYKSLFSTLFACICGGGAALAAAALWGVLVCCATEQRFGVEGICVGLLVGLAMRCVNHTRTAFTAMMAALLSGVGCVLGDLFVIYALEALRAGITLEEATSVFDFGYIFSCYTRAGVGPSQKTFIFYGIAMYLGYRLNKARPLPKPQPLPQG